MAKTRKQNTKKKASAKVQPGEKLVLVRKHRKAILFNDKEISLLDQYCAKYRIRNKSSFIREIVVSHIMQQMDENYPKLF